MNVDADNPLHFSEICRLCLSKEDMMTPIFEEDDKTKKDMPSLATRILMCASLQVEEGDGFPSQICTKCSGHLDNWYAFKEQCHSSDATLRQHLQTDSKIELPDSDHSEIIRASQHIGYEIFGDNSPQINYSTFGKTPIEMCTAIINDKAVDMKNENRDNTEAEMIGDTITLEESSDEINSQDNPLILGPINDKMRFQSSSGHNFETFSKIPLKKHYFCSNCPEKFLFPSLLKKHCRDFHNSPATFLCSECNKMCSSLKQLWEHKRQEHPKEKKEYLCNWCDESFTDNLNLKKHLQSIHSKKRSQGYLCNCCGKSFSCSGNFKQHVIKVHSKNPPRELCNICGKTVSCLKVHLPIHSEEYYECAECGQRLKWRSSLITHLQVHSSERALPCTVCDKAFKDKVKLLQHMRTHTGETPWVCEHCGRSFNRKWNHIQHVRLHTGVKPYVCSVCGEAFRHNVTMKKHAEKHKAPSDTQ